MAVPALKRRTGQPSTHTPKSFPRPRLHPHGELLSLVGSRIQVAIWRTPCVRVLVMKVSRMRALARLDSSTVLRLSSRGTSRLLANCTARTQSDGQAVQRALHMHRKFGTFDHGRRADEQPRAAKVSCIFGGKSSEGRGPSAGVGCSQAPEDSERRLPEQSVGG